MRFLLTAAVAAASWTATAVAAPAPLTLAPAADGGLDIRDAKSVVAHVALKTAALRRGQPRLRQLVVEEGHRVAELRVPIRGTPAEEVWVGEIGGKPRVVWSGIAGPRDADGETAIGVDVSEDGVSEFQTSSIVTRCDGPARLFPRVYDFDAGKFRPVM